VDPTDVFVVEDDPRLLAAIASVLEEEGFTVRTFARADLVLETIAVDVPRLIVTDQEMPGATGHELLREVRARLSDRAPPFLLVTGADVPRAQVQGFEGVLYKPFRLDDLLIEARRLGLRRRPSETRIKPGAASDDEDDEDDDNERVA
jgi:DNA-binding response OmpR family regulator